MSSLIEDAIKFFEQLESDSEWQAIKPAAIALDSALIVANPESGDQVFELRYVRANKKNGGLKKCRLLIPLEEAIVLWKAMGRLFESPEMRKNKARLMEAIISSAVGQFKDGVEEVLNEADKKRAKKKEKEEEDDDE